MVQWVPEKGRPDNKVIRFTLDREVAENEGLMYYSEPFPIEEGATYRFQCRWRSDGPTLKVFIKCYDEDETGRRREVYRSQQNLKAESENTRNTEGDSPIFAERKSGQSPNTWNTQTEDFTPHHTKYSPKWGRVMLYAYLSPGAVEFDDVVVKQIVPPSSGEKAKVRRPSKESDVTVKEMQEDEQRGKESKDQKSK